ncbi:methyltransferase-like protein [Acrasis kona]|uniref:Methyltransferase-like protein n=1 Tax=Acrasis kona TaxID=1008807 RepID=A0AAW2ZFT7_9EUKA
MLFSPSADRNKEPIVTELKRFISNEEHKGRLVLEISSGSGQHISHFARTFPGVTFQPSEYNLTLETSNSISQYSKDLDNVKPALSIDVSKTNADAQWGDDILAIININMTHISPWCCTEGLFKNASRFLSHDGFLFTYGPFNVDQQFTSEGNFHFDQSLKRSNPLYGIRDVGDLEKEAEKNNLYLVNKIQMPANNLLLVWKKNKE